VTGERLPGALLLGLALAAAGCGRSGFDDPVMIVVAGDGGGGGQGGTTCAGGNPKPASISCGSQSCNPASQVCCASYDGTRVQAACADATRPCATGKYTLACKSSASCSCGNVCCVALDGTNRTSCVPAGSCKSPTGVMACEVDADCPATATAGCCPTPIVSACTVGDCLL
jgi:hypothetical protein